MNKSHILWNEDEVVINKDGIECLNLEASTRFYDAFKSEFEKRGKVKSPEETKMLFSVAQATKIEDKHQSLAISYMEALKKQDNRENDDSLAASKKEEQSEHKYQRVIDFYQNTYVNLGSGQEFRRLMSLHSMFTYNDDEWIEISKTLDEKFDNYEHTERLEYDFKASMTTKKMVGTKDITLGEKIDPQTFLMRLAFIKNHIDKKPIALSSIQLNLDSEEVVRQFSKVMENEKFEDVLDFVTRNWNSENVYCYDAIVEYLKSNIKEEDSLDDDEIKDEDLLDDDEIKDVDYTEVDDPELDDENEEKEEYTIVRRLKKAQQTAKDHPKVVYSIVAGTGIISLLICTFVFGHNPISVISNCVKAFTGLFSNNPAFAPLAKRLGELAIYFGSIIVSWKGFSKLTNEISKEGNLKDLPIEVDADSLEAVENIDDEDLTVSEEDLSVSEEEDLNVNEEDLTVSEEDLNITGEDDLNVNDEDLNITDDSLENYDFSDLSGGLKR